MSITRFAFPTLIQFGAGARRLVAAGGGAAFGDWLVRLQREIGIEGGPSRHGIAPAPLLRPAALAAADVTSTTNPRPATAAADERLLRQAM